ncbi:MAG: hypothetical protein MZV65_52130 [Chromatiales bacterium]|nr:hypothetical protein [Chromatiales bacterium]
MLDPAQQFPRSHRHRAERDVQCPAPPRPGPRTTRSAAISSSTLDLANPVGSPRVLSNSAATVTVSVTEHQCADHQRLPARLRRRQLHAAAHQRHRRWCTPAPRFRRRPRSTG